MLVNFICFSFELDKFIGTAHLVWKGMLNKFGILVLLKGMPSNIRVYNPCICHAGLLSLVDDSLTKKKAHS